VYDNNQNPDKWEMYEEQYREMLLFDFNESEEEE
jgi:hypothetical protein